MYQTKTLTKGQRTFINKIRKKAGKTIYQQRLIEDGDCVLVGVSGGKDSMALVDILASLRKAFPFKFELKVAHIVVRQLVQLADAEKIKALCDFHGVEFHKIEVDIDFKRDPSLSPCFKCAWGRRSRLFRLTEELGCNKLAFGHHMDDANETLIMNILFNGEISSLPYSVEMFGGKFYLIRPMLELEDKDLGYYANLLDLKAETRRCPNTKTNRRDYVRKMLNEFYEIHPGLKKNVFRAPQKYIAKYLPLPLQSAEIQETEE